MTRFLQSNRSQIGLVDIYDLSEIYTQDSRFALLNMLLDPEGLDQIFRLSREGLTKEDIRTAGGLDRPVIHSLGISDNVLSRVSSDLSNQITTDKAIGEPGKHSFSSAIQSDNIIVFSGGIAANKIEYNFLDEKGDLRTTTVPTSRESLFDSLKDDAGLFTEAFYSGLFRIRRRSHVNEIKLDSSLLIEKAGVIESPTDIVKIPIYMRTGTNTSPSVTLLSTYATKNSPIILPVRINSSASISFSRKTANAQSPAFVYGWELRRFSDNLLIRSQTLNTQGNILNAPITIDVSGTPGAGVDCLLYVYLDPSAVTFANLSGIRLTELSGGQDIGLIGFDNLEELNLSNNNLSTLPVWLKTLYQKLRVLNLRENTFWNNGIVSFFDYQDLRGSGITGASTIAPPNITLTQVLGYSGYAPSGQKITGYDGDYTDVKDTNDILYKDIRANSISGNTQATISAAEGFRVFTAITDLNIGPTARLVNPDFSKIFPNLQNLTIDRPNGNSPRVLFGLIPKLRNNNQSITLILDGHDGNTGGSIKYMGDTLEWDSTDSEWSTSKADQFIGQFRVTDFNVNSPGGGVYSGGICTQTGDVATTTTDGLPRYHHVTSGSAVAAWSGWLSSLRNLNLRRNDIAFKIAGGGLIWSNLRFVDIHWAGDYGTRNKVEYNAGVTNQQATDVLNATQLTTIEGWRGGWWGKIFSIAPSKDLQRLQLGANEWYGYSGPAGEEYLLPENFVDPALTGNFSGLRFLYLNSIWGADIRNLELRTTDLQNLPKLEQLHLTDSYVGGRFPSIPNNSLTSGVNLEFWIRNCRFRDLDALGSTRVRTIWAPLQGSGVGGALLPVFSPQASNNVLEYVEFNSSLSSRYPGNWGITNLRNFVISSLAPGQTPESITPSETWTSRNNNNTSNANSDKLYHSSPGAYFPSTQIMVGDEALQGSTVIGRVTQIDRNHAFIYINTDVSLVSQSLTFRRRGQDISNYFNNHFNLDRVFIRDCRLVGSIPQFIGCTRIRTVDLDNNILSDYVAGTLKNITGVAANTSSPPRLQTFSLNNNALSVPSIRAIISDLHDIAVYFFTKRIRVSIRIRLLGTKLDPTLGQYQNWTRSEIFNQTSTSGDGNTISDPLETKFDQIGPGTLYPGITIELF
jgi:hypothetical protein